VGHDDLGRPVIYSCLRNASNRSTEDNRLHMLATFEQVIGRLCDCCATMIKRMRQHRFCRIPTDSGASVQAIRMMPEGVSQWVWASDFHGFGYKDLDPRMARIFLHVSAEHYPERLVRTLQFDRIVTAVDPVGDRATPSTVADCAASTQHGALASMACGRRQEVSILAMQGVDACQVPMLAGALLGDRPSICFLGVVEDGPAVGGSCHKSQGHLLQVCNPAAWPLGAC
jgi:CRAL/TRIO domain